MNKEIIENLMDKYAQGNLSEEEQKQLASIVEGSPELNKELVIRKDIVKSIQYLEKKDLVEMISKIHTEEIEKPKEKVNWIKALALLVIAILSGLTLFNVFSSTEETQEPKKIYASYYKSYEPISASRGESVRSEKEAFTIEYLKKDYKSALSIILPEITNQDNEIILMTAISAIETNDLILAHSLLDGIIKEKDYYYTDHARWYQAMAFLKESKIDEAKIELKILSSNASADHHTEATDLLSNL